MCTLPWALKLFVVFVKDWTCAYCLKWQLLSSCESVYLLLWCPSVGKRELPALPPPLFFCCFFFLYVDVYLSCSYVCTQLPAPFFPQFYLCPHFSKSFPRKKNRVQIACCILFWCVCVYVCVCQLLPQLMFYCFLLCVKPDETVYCRVVTTHYVYRLTLTPLFSCLFLRVHSEEWKLLN